MAKRIYNRVKDKPDARDYHYRAERPVAGGIPDKIDLVQYCSDPFDQGNLGSCTANAICGAMQFDENIQGEQKSILSRLFLYYQERSMEGDIDQDGGAQIRDGIKAVSTTGVCLESLWPYEEDKFEVSPPQVAYEDASKHKGLLYRRVDQDVDSLCHALASGYPVVIGITVFASLESDQVAQDGMVPMPDVNSEECLGGHAVLLVGYDKTKQLWKVRNSWGSGWGDQGNFYLPFDYLTDPNLSSDFWVVNKIN